MMRLFPVLATLLLVSGCGGSSGTTAAPQPTLSQAPSPSASPCPVGTGKAFAWPKEVPKDLPQPPNPEYAGVTRTKDGLTIVRFSTKSSMQSGVLFVVKEIQKAGFTLGRGDAEPAEADAPFGRGNLRGVYKLLNRSECATDWLVAVTTTRPTSNSPLLPTPTGTPGSQPLPFG